MTDLRLPGDPRDAHVRAAGAMLRRLADAYPRAGLGITGSVGRGTQGPGSDLDLVVVDAAFRREAQFATFSEGIRTAVLCLRPDLDAERERRWLLAASGDVPMISMVRTAFVARDPSGQLEAMQRTVARLDAERRARRDELVAVRREHALAAVRALHGGSGASDEHLQLELYSAIVDGWLLRQGLVIDSRAESDGVLDTIAGREAALAALLRRATPLTQVSMAALLRAFDHVFGKETAERGGS
ncbi:MAG TPA: nucleotidyltransferase domain-containing protein [Longimicrobium sp.]|nr:nucleotidyltransferase domain-containing protein [Longimicrobium sp.]